MSESTEACLGGVAEKGNCSQQEVCGLRVCICILAIGEWVFGWVRGELHERQVCVRWCVCMGGQPDHGGALRG